MRPCPSPKIEIPRIEQQATVLETDQVAELVIEHARGSLCR